jgi:hypothetical protein
LVSVYLIWRTGGIASNKVSSSDLPASSHVVAPQQPVPTPVQTVASAAPAPNPPQVQTAQVPKPAPSVPQPVTITPATSSSLPPSALQLLPPSQASSHPEADSQAVDPSAAGPEPEIAAIHIELSAVQPTWLSISTDGKTTYRGTLGAMKTVSFDGKETAQIRTANAGGVNIIFNGRALGPLGRRGQSRTFVFTKGGYEVVQGVNNSGG